MGVEELHLSRRQIFEIERKMAVQEQSSEREAAWNNRKHEQASHRLFRINRALQEKLCQKTKRVADLEARMQHEKWLKEEMKGRSQKLEDELRKHTRMHKDMLMRECEYGKRNLRLHLKEFEGLCHDEKRVKRLERVISGDGQPNQQGQLTEAELAKLAEQTLADVQAEFETFFQERQSQFQALVMRSEVSFDEQHEALEISSRRVPTFGSSRALGSGMSTPAQTDLTFPLSTSVEEVPVAAGTSSVTGGVPEPQKKHWMDRKPVHPVLKMKRGTFTNLPTHSGTFSNVTTPRKNSHSVVVPSPKQRPKSATR